MLSLPGVESRKGKVLGLAAFQRNVLALVLPASDLDLSNKLCSRAGVINQEITID